LDALFYRPPLIKEFVYILYFVSRMAVGYGLLINVYVHCNYFLCHDDVNFPLSILSRVNIELKKRKYENGFAIN